MRDPPDVTSEPALILEARGIAGRSAGAARMDSSRQSSQSNKQASSWSCRQAETGRQAVAGVVGRDVTNWSGDGGGRAGGGTGRLDT